MAYYWAAALLEKAKSCFALAKTEREAATLGRALTARAAELSDPGSPRSPMHAQKRPQRATPGPRAIGSLEKAKPDWLRRSWEPNAD
jgi:hypothetical protein